MGNGLVAGGGGLKDLGARERDRTGMVVGNGRQAGRWVISVESRLAGTGLLKHSYKNDLAQEQTQGARKKLSRPESIVPH